VQLSPMVKEPLTVEHALLGYLRRQPMHGYQIFQTMARHTGLGLVWRIKQSQLYALLDRLERDGYVNASIEPQEARPPRKIFHITPQGEQAYLTWVSEPVSQPRRIRVDFLAKFYFALQEPPPLARQLITRQRDMCQQWLDALSQEHAKATLEPVYDPLVWTYRIRQVQACQEWLDDCEKVIGSHENAG
jgi:PadR family transcriptional regulator AphA